MKYVKGLFDGAMLYLLISQIEIGIWYHDQNRLQVLGIFALYVVVRIFAEMAI